MLFSRKTSARHRWNSDEQTPVIRCSICTGEQEAGFINRRTGAFTGVMLIRNADDLEEFRETYGIQDTDIRKIY
ncbi:MAG: aspartate dehydrogenase [Clostridia bacterium]|nr:aspartate dehydrogenase [Clostridia bacterium]MBR4459188.1 aspartate dehydrogenase [Clostridia bacterium]